MSLCPNRKDTKDPRVNDEDAKLMGKSTKANKKEESKKKEDKKKEKGQIQTN